MILADAIGPGEPISVWHDLGVLWFNFIEPLGGIFLLFWLWVLISWRWDKHKKKVRTHGTRFYDPRHDAPYR